MATQSQRDGELRYAQTAELTSDDGFNPRRTIDEGALAELTESVRRRGILRPLLARSGDPAGWCWWRDTGVSPPRAPQGSSGCPCSSPPAATRRS